MSVMGDVLSPKSKAPSCGSVLVYISSGMENISLLIPEDKTVTKFHTFTSDIEEIPYPNTSRKDHDHKEHNIYA